MPTRPYYEWGSAKLLYVDNQLLRQMADWKTAVEHVSGYFGHQVTLRRYQVWGRDGKPAGDDPTLVRGRCIRCSCGVIICAEYTKGIRWFRMNRRCVGRVSVDKGVSEALQEICRRRGNRPVAGIDTHVNDGFVIRTLAERLKVVNEHKSRMIR